MDNRELKHYGVPGMRWGVRRGSRTKLTGSIPRIKGPVPVKDERPKKSERQKRYEDDHGINPHRPNGTRNGKRIKDMNLGALDKSPVVQYGKRLVDALLDRDTMTKR